MMLLIHYLSNVPNILLTIKFNPMVSFGLFTKAQCTPKSSCCELVVYSERLIANLRSIRPDLSQCLKVRDDLYGTKENETFPENCSCSPNYKFPNLSDILIFGWKIALEKYYKCSKSCHVFASQNDHLLFWNIFNSSWCVVSSLTTVAWGCRNFKSRSLPKDSVWM